MLDQPGRSARWFPWTLVAIALVALAVRVTYVLVARRNFHPGFGDALFYHAGANLLADGKGFISPFAYPAARLAAAEHPPFYMVYLAIPSFFGMHSVLTHLLWSCVLGTGTVVFVGLIGRQVGGPLVGVVAAGLAAIYPNLWAPDAMLQAETAAMFMTVLVIWLAYRYRAEPNGLRLAVVGGACGLAALARSELLLLMLFLVLPLALLTRTEPIRVRLQWLGAAVLAMILVILPWTAYNAKRFTHPVFLSAQAGQLLSSANCHSTYYGSQRGYFDINCTIAADKAQGVDPNADESVSDLANRRAAWRYISAHLSKVPEVEGVRLLRIVGLYKPAWYVQSDSLIEGRDLWVSWTALWSFYAVALLAIGGAVVVRRRANSPPLFVLLAPVGTVLFTVLVTYASTRFRAAAEPTIVVLAAVAITAIVRRLLPAPDQQPLAASGSLIL